MMVEVTVPLTTQSDISKEINKNYKHNFVVNFLATTVIWFGISFIAHSTILPVYIAKLTNKEFIIAYLSMIIATGYLLPQLFTANWVQRLPVKKYVPVKVGFWADRLPVLLFVPGAWLATISKDLALIVSLVAITWHIIGTGIGAVGWQDMIAKIFPVENRGKFAGISNFSGTISGILGAIAATLLLDRFPFPYGFMWSFLVGGISIMIAWFFLSMTKEPALLQTVPNQTNQKYFGKLIEILRRDQNLRSFLITQIFSGGRSMAFGFYAVYAFKHWNLVESQAGTFTLAMLIGQAPSNLLLGWIADKKGHKLNLEICAIVTALSLGIAAFTTSETWFYLVFILMGISSAGIIISGQMFIYEFCTPEIRPTYIGINNTFNGIVAMIMPLFGGLLINLFGYQAMFLVAFIICVIGFFLLKHWVHEPRQSTNH